MKQIPLITDFTAGELSPRMAGRADLELYAKGVSELENWVPFLQGGITTRPGLKYMGSCKASASVVRLVPFIISENVGYVVEMGLVSGVGYLRLWLNGVYTGIEFADASFPYSTAAQIGEIQFAQDAADLYLAQKDFPPRKLTYVSSVSFTLATVTVVGNSGQLPFQTSGSYPGSVALWGGRLWWGGSTNQPQALWASEVWNPTDGYTHYHYFDTVSYSIQEATDPSTWSDPTVPEYTTTTTTKDIISDSNAIQITLVSDQNEKIMWLAPGRDLIVGCSTSEFRIPAGVTALTIGAELQTRYGSTNIQGKLVNDAILFVQAGAKRIREYFAAEQQAAYQSPELTFHAEHILGPGIVDMDFSQSWQPMVYCVRSDGELSVLVYSKGYGVQAWCRYVIDGDIESVAVVVGSDGIDDIYVCTLRNGLRYIELFDPLLEPVYSLDSYSIHTKASSITGLDRFEGDTVTIVHGANSYTALVTSGIATMPATIADGQTIGIGIPFTCEAKTNKVPFQLQYGTGQMAYKRVVNVGIRLLESYPFKVAQSATDSYPETIELESSPYTGDVHAPFTGDWNKDGYVTFIQDDPFPVTILAVAPEVKG